MAILGLLSALAALAIYGGMFVVGRQGNLHGIDGFDQAALRYAVASLLILPFWWRQGLAALRRLGVGRLGVLFLLSGAPYVVVFLSALAVVPAAHAAAIISGLQPLSVMIVAGLWHGARPSGHTVAGAAICIIGLAMMMVERPPAPAEGLWVGVAILIGIAMAWGGYVVSLKTWEVTAQEGMATTAPISAVLFLPVYAGWRGPEALLAAAPEALALQVFYQGVLMGAAAIFLYTYGVKAAGAPAVATLAPAMPVTAALFGLLFLGEDLTALQWAGLGVVSVGLLIGVLWTSLRRAPPPV